MAKSTHHFKAKYTFEDIIGQSSTLIDAVERAKFIAVFPENVMITGESGVGKELFAQSIHNAWNPEGPFLALNCAAFPQGLIESELFGYEPGTFTGALKTGKAGKVELADGGTLFLDEIGDMPLEIQAILLRVLQEKQVTRIGSSQSRKVNFRVISATNQDIRNPKRFRPDLYFRLAVLQLDIPPLRERSLDIELYVRFFLEQYCRKIGISPAPQITQEAMAYLFRNQWPGNVRELQNVVINLINSSRGQTIDVGHLPMDVLVGPLGFSDGVALDRERGYPRQEELASAHNSSLIGRKAGSEPTTIQIEPLEDVINRHILWAMQALNNNVTAAAKALGLSKATLYRRLSDMGYDVAQKRKQDQ